MKKKAVVLLSGGLDSVTCLAIAAKEKYALHALSFDYGQRHRIELALARENAEKAGAKFHLVSFRLGVPEASALTSKEAAVPDYIEGEHGIPATYVPARNLVFLSFATALAESIGAKDIFIGVNSLDYSGYPDCRPEFIEAFNKTISVGTKQGCESKIEVVSPIMRMSKCEIIRLGTSLGVDYSLTHSCYDPTPEGLSCGVCDSCRLRLEGFRQAGLTDPVKYR